jgi:tetratricopeptide (TPR) repeat protein
LNKPIAAAALVSCACTILSAAVSVADESRPLSRAADRSTGQKGSAETLGLAQLEQKYKAGDYASAVKIGEIVVKRDGDNGIAHYYYASALAKLNRKEEAILEFRKAYNRTEQPTLKSYCEQAIEALSEPAADSRHASAAAAPGAASGTASQAQSHNGSAATVSSTQTPVDKQNNTSASLQEKDLLERKASILEEGANQIDHLRQEAADDIKKLKKNVTDQMVDVPQRVRAFHGWVENPDYAPMLAKLNSEAQENIDKINTRVAKETAEITENCNRRATAYDETMPNMTSQLKTGKSQIQLMPQNSNPYLRNFVNYDGSIPGALKAKAGTLPADKAPQSKPNH